MVVIVDYGMGNLLSVAKAAQFLGKKIKITSNAKIIKQAVKIILPGVGHFGQAVVELQSRKIFDIIKNKIDAGVPFLGICVGMQLLFERSQEAGKVKGLAKVFGSVERFNSEKLIVPHMGWNAIKMQSPKSKTRKSILSGIKQNSYFYFAHSYYCQPADPAVVLAYANYGKNFAAVVNHNNIWGIQFHPEKSQKLGLQVFNNFLEL